MLLNKVSFSETTVQITSGNQSSQADGKAFYWMQIHINVHTEKWQYLPGESPWQRVVIL